MCDLALLRLPRDCVDKLICCECNDYLRTGLVKTTLDGDSICGKCSNNPKYASAIYTKALNDVLSVVAFPCTYEKYGCQEYSIFNDPSNHEERCDFCSYGCPADFVTCSWVGTALQIPQHYKENHKDLCMNLPVLEIHVSQYVETARLYMLEDFAFLVKSMISREDGQLWINLEYIGDKDVAKEIIYKLIFHGNDLDAFQTILKARAPGHLSKKTLLDQNNVDKVDIKSLVNLLQEPDAIFCTLSIYIPKVVIEKVYKQLTRIKCSSCSVFMSIPIYQCPDGHNVCTDCISYNCKCPKCKKEGVVFNRNSKLESISASHLLKCRWRNCKLVFSQSELRKHEQKCHFKSYKCPRCSKFRGNKDEIIKHFAEYHKDYTLHLSEVTIKSDTDAYDFSIFNLEEIFQCSFQQKSEDAMEFVVRYNGLPTFCNNYSYLVEAKSEKKTKSYKLSKAEAFEGAPIFNLVLCKRNFHFDGSYHFIFKIVENNV